MKAVEDNVMAGYKDSPLGKIPVEWEVVKLGKLLSKIVGGGTPSRDNPDYWNGEIPWATVKDLKDNVLDKVEEYITEKGLEESSANFIEKCTLIIATRMALGKAVIFKMGVAINQDLKAIYPKKNLLTDFLRYWFYNNAEFIESLGSGSTVKGIRLEILKSLNFLLPPLPEQRKIADILSTVDDKIAVIDEQIAQTQQLKKGLMQRLLTRGIGHTEFKDSPLGRIPAEWEVVRLGEILIENPQYGANVSAIDYSEKTYRYIRITDIDDNGKLIEEEKKGILKEVGKQYILKEKDILIARTGNTVGKSYIHLKIYGSCSYAGYLIRFRTDPSKYLAQLLFHFLHSDNYWKWVGDTARTGAQPNINSKEYQKLKLPFPPLPEQRQIAEILSTVDDKIGHLLDKKESYQQQKKGLMQNLLTGKIRVKV